MKIAPYQDKEYLNQLINEGMNISQIAKKFNVDRGTISYWCKKLSLSIEKQIGQKRKYSLNTDFFKKIDSEEKAYILGFIMADGYIESNGRSLAIKLDKKDIDILEKIKKCLNSDAPIGFREDGRYRILSICSKEIVTDLQKLSVVINKTSTLTFPVLNSNLYSHFLRGYFDGDGHIGKRQCALIVGSLGFLNDLLVFLESEHNIKPWVGDNTTYYHIQFNKRDSFFINWLYTNAQIYLDRKYEAFNKYWCSEKKAVELGDKKPLG